MPQSKTKTIMKNLPINEVSQYRSDVTNFWANAEKGMPVATVHLINALKNKYPDEKREWKTIVPALNEELKNRGLIRRKEWNSKSWISNGFCTSPSDFTFAPPAKKAINPKKYTTIYDKKTIENESFLDMSIRNLKKLGATVTVQF